MYHYNSRNRKKSVNKKSQNNFMKKVFDLSARQHHLVLNQLKT